MSDYVWFEGIPFPTLQYEKERIEKTRDNFVIRDEDIVLLAYPKSGSNWLTEIVCLIQTKGDPNWIQSEPIWERSIWLESHNGYKKLISTEGPRLISSHLPFHLFPKSFFSSKAKVIYVIRNPRDVLVSGYFFWCKTNIAKNPESLTTYFEWFLRGNVLFGSWFEHTRAWMSMRERDNFLLLSFEDIKKVGLYTTVNTALHRSKPEDQMFKDVIHHEDTKCTIEKICDFLGKKLEPDELDMVLTYSSFQAMKENKMSNYSLIPEDVAKNGLVLLRKGTTGDWKNHFTVTQAEAFDKVFQEKMAGFSPGLFPWE